MYDDKNQAAKICVELEIKRVISIVDNNHIEEQNFLPQTVD